MLTVEVGDDQNILFQEGGNGPLSMTPQEHVSAEFSKYDEPLLKDKTKYMLIGNIKISVVDKSVVKGKRVGYMQNIAHQN